MTSNILSAALTGTVPVLVTGLAVLAVALAGVSTVLYLRVRAYHTASQALSDSMLRAACNEANVLRLLEHWPDAVFFLRGGRAAYVNEAGAKLLAFDSMAQAKGLRLEDHLHPDEVLAERERMGLALGGQRTELREVRMLRKDGGVARAELFTASLMLHGEPVLITAARDVTERSQLEHRLLVADRMASVGTLAAGVAHEINNPLAYVAANLKFLQDELKDLSLGLESPAPDGRPADPKASSTLKEMADALAEARQGAERVRNIVRDLKTFSRQDEEQQGPVEVQSVLESAVKMARNEIRHRAKLVSDYGDVPRVVANEGRLSQVILNLLMNACQALPDGAADRNEIRVRSRRDAQGRVVMEVEDTGCGMSAHTLKHLFDPFFTTKPVGVGTGLGLSICHNIITALGGEILVESQLGRGTTFRVVLPAAPEETLTVAATPSEAEERPLPPTSEQGPGSIWIVDDEPLVARSIGRMLGRAHKILFLTGAHEALERLQNGERFDLLLCDLMMPEMTGMDLLEVVKHTHPEYAHRMVFMTGGVFTDKMRELLESVNNPVLEKPFDVKVLRSLIANALPN